MVCSAVPGSHGAPVHCVEHKPWMPSVIFASPGWRAIFKNRPGPDLGRVGPSLWLLPPAGLSRHEQDLAPSTPPGLG